METAATKRNSRLRREVGSVLAAGRADTLADALAQVIGRPLTKGFYIAPDTAIQTDLRRRKVGTLNFLNSVKQTVTRQKWADFFAAVDARQAQFPTATRQQLILSALADATAPHGFYIDYHEAIRILRK